MPVTGKGNVILAQWLREEVAPTYDAWKTGLGRAISPKEMAERACERHLARLRQDDLAEGDTH